MIVPNAGTTIRMKRNVEEVYFISSVSKSQGNCTISRQQTPKDLFCVKNMFWQDQEWEIISGTPISDEDKANLIRKIKREGERIGPSAYGIAKRAIFGDNKVVPMEQSEVNLQAFLAACQKNI